ncbi:hypothetical protein VTH06DRAFT_8706 [Thermothelomyces fergusii]
MVQGRAGSGTRQRLAGLEHAESGTMSPSTAAASPAMDSLPHSPASEPVLSTTTTAVSSPDERGQDFAGSPGPLGPDQQGAASFRVLLAKLATFTDAFLSGLVLPMFPTILEQRTLLHRQLPPETLQLWISAAVSAHGGGFALASPLISLLTRQGPGGFAVLLAGLASTAAAFALFQFSDDVLLLLAARALQGLAAAALAGASSGFLGATRSTGRGWFSIDVLQNAAMTTAPSIGGLLHDRYGMDALFRSAYSLIALNVFLALLALATGQASPAGSAEERAAILQSATRQGGYGTIVPTETGIFSSRTSSRSVSPRSIPLISGLQNPPESLAAVFSWSPRLVAAFGGYLVLNLITSALQSMLPLFVQRQFEWPALAGGAVFVPLSAPATVLGPLSGAIAARLPRSIRFLATTGFLAYIPALMRLGQLEGKSKATQCAFLLTLAAISSASGLIASPLVKEMADAAEASSASGSWGAAAQANAAPMLATAWGGLLGPALAAASDYLSGWPFMTRSLAAIAGGTGAGALLFLQGWIASPFLEALRRPAAPSSDEEAAAPLLRGSAPNDGTFQSPEAYGGKEDQYARSDGGSSDARRDGNRKHRPQRRHFNVDNFSVATTAGPGSVDSSTSSVRFQAALETPVQGRKRSGAGDGTSKAGSTERRYVMREAPHAPATDPLLAEGSLYVIDEERDTAQGVERQRQNRRVVVFPEGAAPPELLARNRHHVVAINALDGTAHMVSESTDDHALHVTEEPVVDDDGDDDEAAFQDANCRRYVVVIVEGDDAETE